MSESLAFKIAIPTCNVLAIIGGVFIVFNILVAYFKTNRDTRRFTRHQVLLASYALNTTILGVGAIIYNLLDFQNSRVVCVLQALHITFFNLTGWFWSSAIVINIFIFLVVDAKLKNAMQSEAKKRKRDLIFTTVFLVTCWGVPLIFISLVIIFNHQIRPLGTWCWISGDAAWLRFLSFYGWAMISFFINLIFTVFTSIALIKEYGKLGINYLRQLSGRSAVYGIVFLVCWIFGVVIRCIEIFVPGFYNFPLFFIHTVLSISCCFWVAIAFIYCEQLFELYKVDELFRKICCCCQNRIKRSIARKEDRSERQKKVKDMLKPINSESNEVFNELREDDDNSYYNESS